MFSFLSSDRSLHSSTGLVIHHVKWERMSSAVKVSVDKQAYYNLGTKYLNLMIDKASTYILYNDLLFVMTSKHH